jgi:hypothetical protein
VVVDEERRRHLREMIQNPLVEELSARAITQVN